VEDEIFKTRRHKDLEFRRRNKQKKRRNTVREKGGGVCTAIEAWVV